MIGLKGCKLLADEKSFLQQVQPAGVIYFRRNVKSPAQLRALSKEVRAILGPRALIGIDQEGGRVSRLGEPFTHFPGNDFLGRGFQKDQKVDLAVAQARAMAQELKSIGVNFNFTPVADIDSNPRNPIIGNRAFGKDPKTVSRLVAATVRAYREMKVISCAKHFPGHGDTFVDSHKMLPVVRVGRRTLLRRELLPFQAAIASRVPTIMTAHVVYPALDAKNPATLSSKILKNLLRKKLGFKGVVVSDDLEMNAIARHQSIPEAAVEALGAGVDLLLVCKTLTLAVEVYEQVKTGVCAGKLDPKEVVASVRRISRLKKSLSPPRGSTALTWPQHVKLAQQIQRIGG